MLMKRHFKSIKFSINLRSKQNYFKPSYNESATAATRVTVVTATKIQQLDVLHAGKEVMVVFFTFPQSQDVSP